MNDRTIHAPPILRVGAKYRGAIGRSFVAGLCGARPDGKNSIALRAGVANCAACKAKASAEMAKRK